MYNLNIIIMEKTKILFIAVFGVVALVTARLAWDDYLNQNYASAVIMVIMLLFCLIFLVDIWYKSPKMKQAELFYEQKRKALKFLTEHKRGTKAAFCQQYGEDVYDHCLNKGYIHEPLDCDAQNLCWEATKHAYIVNSELNNTEY